MEKVQQIEHRGIIKAIEGNNIKVSILAKSACLSCQLKTSCNVSDIEEKLVDITSSDAKIYNVGETVDVFYRQTLGYRALFLAYLLPFLIVMTVLIIMIIITGKEGLSGITALATLIPYYFILKLSKGKINRTFLFSLKRANTKYSVSGIDLKN